MSEVKQVSGHFLPPIKARTAEDVGRFSKTSRVDEAVANALNAVYEHAILNGISDIHMEIDEIDGMDIRIRSHGDLKRFGETLTPDEARIAKTKICAKAKLDDQERLVPQDGRMMLYFGGRRVDIRLAITPTVSGFKIVNRLLDSNNSNTKLESLDVGFIIKETMRRVISQPEGMVLMSGPTGSGKTTTLYALMHELKDEIRHILTIENPVEYSVKGFTQIDVDARMTFGKAMRAALRMDPDVMMIGEIRDLESAEIAVQAGQSGHMVLSTVHANSAVDTIARLSSLGLKSYHISAVLSAVIAQRLIKRIDPDAVLEWSGPNEIEKEWLISRGVFFEGMKFPRVADKDLTGRLPIVEMIEITSDIRALIDAQADASEIVNAAGKQAQFETLSQSGVRLALAGKTTLKQVMSATGDITLMPSEKRLEQKLVEHGLINVFDLDKAHEVRYEAIARGQSISLTDALIQIGVINQEQINLV